MQRPKACQPSITETVDENCRGWAMVWGMTAPALAPVVAPDVLPLPRPLEQLEAKIVELSCQLSAATCRLLVMIGEFDAAEGWRSWGMASTAHWLSWQCGVGLAAAREQVRVARSMRTFPTVTEAFGDDRLSYSKVRAITRIATAGNVEILIDWAEHCTAAQLERVVAGQRRVVRTQKVRGRKAALHMKYRWDDDGSLVGSFRLTPEDGVRFLQGLGVALGRLPESVDEVEAAENESVTCGRCGDASAETHEWCPEVAAITRHTARSPVKSNADALVLMAESIVSSAAQARSATPDPGLPGLGDERFQLVIHASAESLAAADDADDTDADGIQLENGPRMHPSTGRRLSCGCPYSKQVDDTDGNPLHLGRSTRRIRGRLARAVHRRDHGRCQAPGCTNATTEIHHILHSANGGPTCLSNLISLCDAHHWLVHDGGWTLTGTAPVNWMFRAPDGRTIRATPAPARPAGDLRYDTRIRPDAITGKWCGEPLDLHAAVQALFSRASQN
jgi:hypothetical protein